MLYITTETGTYTTEALYYGGHQHSTPLVRTRRVTYRSTGRSVWQVQITASQDTVAEVDTESEAIEIMLATQAAHGDTSQPKPAPAVPSCPGCGLPVSPRTGVCDECGYMGQ